MKFFLTLILIIAGTITFIFTLTPAKYQIPDIVQVFMNLKDPNNDHDGNLDELEAMQKNPLLCYQNTDCKLVKCGSAPNCNSYPVNLQQYKKDINTNQFTCTEIGCKEELYKYVACEDNECIIKNLKESPSPTPSAY